MNVHHMSVYDFYFSLDMTVGHDCQSIEKLPVTLLPENCCRTYRKSYDKADRYYEI